MISVKSIGAANRVSEHWPRILIRVEASRARRGRGRSNVLTLRLADAVELFGKLDETIEAIGREFAMGDQIRERSVETVTETSASPGAPDPTWRSAIADWITAGRRVEWVGETGLFQGTVVSSSGELASVVAAIVIGDEGQPSSVDLGGAWPAKQSERALVFANYMRGVTATRGYGRTR